MSGLLGRGAAGRTRRAVVIAPVVLVIAVAAVLWWRSPGGPASRGVAAYSGCVPSVPAGSGPVAVSRPRNGLALRIVPVLPLPIGPVRSTLCRYAYPPGSSSGTLLVAARLDAARTSEAAGWLDTAVESGAVPHACPTGPGPVDVLTFGYQRGPDVVVTVRHADGGCGLVSNGVLSAIPGPALLQGLDGLAEPVRARVAG